MVLRYTISRKAKEVTDMPNWCDTLFKVTGTNKAKVLKFYMDMAKGVGEFGGLDEKKRTYKDDKGEEKITANDWFGNLYLAAGYTMEEISSREMHTRGFETIVELKEVNGDYCVSISAEMAWLPAIEEMYKMIDEKYEGGLSLYYLAEEPGAEVYYCNDETGDFFDCKYVIDYDTGKGDADRIYYGHGEDQAEEAVRLVIKLTGKTFVNMDEVLSHEEEVQEAFEAKYGSDDAFLSIHEFARSY